MERLPEYVANHPWLFTLAVAAVVAVVAYEVVARRSEFAAISPQDAIRLMNGGAALIDIRSAEQFAAGHIAGARRMDSHDILKASETLRKFKEKPVIVCCDSGSLGAAAARTLLGQGFSKALNLRGGLAAWRAENLPLARGADGARPGAGSSNGRGSSTSGSSSK
jgi:rhodanese-related sulfurtransferase